MSTTRSAFGRQVLAVASRRSCKPATGTAVLPLQSGFRRWFTFRLPCTERLDPSRVGGSSPPSRCGPTSPVDFCHRNDPRAPPPDPPNSAEHHRRRPVGAALLRSPSLAEGLERNCRWQFSFRSTASREFTGQGFRLRTIVRASTFATAIARGNDFAPARSARTPLVASRAAHGLETSVNVEIPPGLVGSRTRSAEAHRFGR